MAEKYHHFIKPIIECRGWNYYEYYDIAIPKYLWAIHRYATIPEIQKYSPVTVIKTSIVSGITSDIRKRDNNCLSLSQLNTRAVLCHGPIRPLASASRTIGDPEENLMERERLTEGKRTTLSAVYCLLNPMQLDIMQMVGNGLSRAEIANMLNVKTSKVSSAIATVRRKVQQGMLVYTE